MSLVDSLATILDEEQRRAIGRLSKPLRKHLVEQQLPLPFPDPSLVGTDMAVPGPATATAKLET